MKIRRLRRNRLQRGPECKRETHQWTMQIARGQRLAATKASFKAGEILGASNQRRLAFQDDPCAKRRYQWNVAHELNRVAIPLFCMQKNGLA